MPRWAVRLRVIGYATVMVEADTEDEATNKAQQYDPWDLDIDVSDTSAEEVALEEDDA